MSQQGYRTSEPLDDAYQLMLPRYLKQAMIMIKRDKGVSGNEFMHMLKGVQLSLHKSMVEKILNLEEGFLADGNNGSAVLLTIR